MKIRIIVGRFPVNILSDCNVYKELAKNPLKDWQRNFKSDLNSICSRFKSDSPFVKKIFSRLPVLPYMYGLPKIHKNDVPFRPIIFNCGSSS